MAARAAMQRAIAEELLEDGDDGSDDAAEEQGGAADVRRFATTEYCKCCPDVIEDIPHVLVDCPAYAGPRQALLADLESRLPPAAFSRFVALPDSQQRAAALLSDALWGDKELGRWVDRRVKALLLSIEALRAAH